jgi:hypothetical protein
MKPAAIGARLRALWRGNWSKHRMNTASWKTKLLGDNRFNFYSWIVRGVIIMGLSLWGTITAISEGAFHSASSRLLGAIYLLLLGQFSLALEIHCGRLAKHLDSKDKQDDSNPIA